MDLIIGVSLSLTVNIRLYTPLFDIIKQTGKCFEANKLFSNGANWQKIKCI